MFLTQFQFPSLRKQRQAAILRGSTLQIRVIPKLVFLRTLSVGKRILWSNEFGKCYKLCSPLGQWAYHRLQEALQKENLTHYFSSISGQGISHWLIPNTVENTGRGKSARDILRQGDLGLRTALDPRFCIFKMRTLLIQKFLISFKLYNSKQRSTENPNWYLDFSGTLKCDVEFISTWLWHSAFRALRDQPLLCH